jgi:hypothetical protein
MTKEPDIESIVFSSILISVEELIDDEVIDGSQSAHGFMMMINELA